MSHYAIVEPLNDISAVWIRKRSTDEQYTSRASQPMQVRPGLEPVTAQRVGNDAKDGWLIGLGVASGLA